MKRTTIITLISFLIPILGMSQTKSTFVDDLYLKPSEAKAQQVSHSQSNQQTQNTRPTSKYKNGAKEIIYIERENPANKVFHDTIYVDGKAYVDGQINKSSDRHNKEGIHDTIYVVGQDNDSIEKSQGNGYYLNGFNGTESDLEYAKRIRQFHNPRYEISIADPRYNDINFLNNNEWNVYVDSTYAYVTPTWTNPYWWNYNYSPYSYGYGGLGFSNFYSPFSYYPGWFDSPWGFDNFYGDFGFGFGYGDYYGYGGYGYCGYGYNSWGNNWYGRNNERNPAHDEGTRRDVSNFSGSGRVGGINNSAQSMSGGGGYSSTNPYTVVSNTGLRASTSQNTGSKSSVSRTNNPSNQNTSRILSTNRNGIGLVRSNGLRNISNLNQSNNRSTGSRSITSYTINTTPRTNRITLSSNPMIVNSGSGRVTNSTNTYTNSGNYSTGTRSSASPVISNSSVSRSSTSYSNSNSSYSSGSSSRSSSSYSGGSTGGSSGGSSGGGGSRSSGGGGGGSRR
jgi:hypothetical protein